MDFVLKARGSNLVWTVVAACMSVSALPAWGQCAEQQKLTASDPAANDRFGHSVSVSGATFVAGAHNEDGVGSDSGSAYVYVLSGGVWTQQQKLTASDAAAGDNFGGAVSISGDTIVVGAQLDDDAGSGSGSAYVFVRSGGVWTQQQKLTASDAAAGDGFGVSVSVNGDTAVIGALQDDGVATDSGSAYVFVRSGSVWTQQQKLTASDAALNEFFGVSVSVNFNTVVVGAYLSNGVGADSGSAYVFVRSGAIWTQQQKLTASDAAAGDHFGRFVSVYQETTVVGADNDDDAGSNSGSAYVFVRSGGVWTQQQKLTASDAAAGDLFGNEVALSGDRIVVGASFDDDAGISSGSAYVFFRSGTVWTQQQKLNASDAAADDLFGRSVAVDVSTIVIGAEFDDHAGGSSAGSAYVFSCCTPPDCNGNGTCNSGTCECDSGYAGAACGQCAPDHYNYPTCTFCQAGTTCSGNGTCNASGACSCSVGFVGAACDQCAPDYHGYPNCTYCVAATTCNGHGTCNVMGECECAPGYGGPACAPCAEGEKLTASDAAAGDAFGYRASISGDTVLVGAYLDNGVGADSGSAYVFIRSGGGWIQQQKLAAPDAAANDWFGLTVSVDGDTAVIGAVQDDDSGTNSGSAYVFTRSGGVWTFQQKLTAPDAAAGDLFGGSVSISGDTVVVGSFRDDDAGTDSGSAYVFVRLAGVWSFQQKLTASDAAAFDTFGVNVSVSGESVVVGAPGNSDAGADSGSAYVFVRSGTMWTEQQKLTAPDASAGDTFGIRNSLSGDTLVVGAPENDDAGTDSGSAYVFVHSAGVWTHQQKLTAPDASLGDLFGQSVSVDGDLAVVGAYSDDHEGGIDAGSAYVFHRSGSVWTLREKRIAFDAATDDEFGTQAAVSGETIVAGAGGNDDNGSDSGSVYVFSCPAPPCSPPDCNTHGTCTNGSCDCDFNHAGTACDQCAVNFYNYPACTFCEAAATCNGHGTCNALGECDCNPGYENPNCGPCYEEQKLTAFDGAEFDEFGISVALDGDTAILGAHEDDDGGSASGSAYVFIRSGGVWTVQQKLTAADAAADDQFGASVSVSGDTSVVGASFDDDAGADSGSAYVFVRSGGVWTQQQKLTALDAAAGDRFGFSVFISGNTAVVGARDDDDAGSGSGSAYVFVRSAGVWTQQQKLTALDGAAFDSFGSSVAIDGDTAVVGAYADDDAGSLSGSAYVFVRAGTVWTQQQKLTASDAASQDLFGRSVSISGDTIMIGSVLNDVAGTPSGSAYVFVRSGAVWSQQQKLTASDAAGVDNFGNSVSLSGNTAVIGSISDDHVGGTSAGSAYVFTRSGGVWTQQHKLTASDPSSDDLFGVAVAINGSTVAVGALRDDHAGDADAGAAYVFSCGENCTADLDCADQNVCTCDRCVMGTCANTPNEYGNTDCSGIVELGDVLCVLAGYADITACPNGDVAPPCTGDEPPFIELGDVLGVLSAYSGGDPCACVP